MRDFQGNAVEEVKEKGFFFPRHKYHLGIYLVRGTCLIKVALGDGSSFFKDSIFTKSLLLRPESHFPSHTVLEYFIRGICAMKVAPWWWLVIQSSSSEKPVTLTWILIRVSQSLRAAHRMARKWRVYFYPYCSPCLRPACTCPTQDISRRNIIMAWGYMVWTKTALKRTSLPIRGVKEGG